MVYDPIWEVIPELQGTAPPPFTNPNDPGYQGGNTGIVVNPVVNYGQSIWKPPADAVVSETNASGKPTVYKTPDNVEHYTPYSSQWQLGFDNSKQYIASQKGGYIDKEGNFQTANFKYSAKTGGYDIPPNTSDYAPRPVATNVTLNEDSQARKTIPNYARMSNEDRLNALMSAGIIPRGSHLVDHQGSATRNFAYYTPYEIVRAQAYESGQDVDKVLASLNEGSPEDRFNAAVKSRLIPSGSKFVPSSTSDPNDWGYLTIAQQNAMRPVAPNTTGYTKLADGKYVDDTEFDNLPAKYRDIGNKKGFDAMNAAIDADEKAIKAVEAKLKTAGAISSTGMIDVVKARKSGITSQELQTVGVDAPSIRDADNINNDISLQRYVPVYEGGTIKRYVDVGTPEDTLKQLKDDKQLARQTLNRMGAVGASPLKPLGQDTDTSFLLNYSGKDLDNFSNLTPPDQQKVAEWVVNDRLQQNATMNYYDANFGKIAAGFVPAVGTLVWWNEMSPGWRAASIAGDALTLTPVKWVTAVGNVARNSKLAPVVDRIVANSAATRATLHFISGKDNPALLNAFDDVTKAQISYADRLNRVREIKAVLAKTDDPILDSLESRLRHDPNNIALQAEVKSARDTSLRVHLENMLEEAKSGVQPTGQKVVDAGQKLLDTQRAGKGGFDDVVPSSMAHVPDELKTSVEHAVNSQWDAKPLTARQVAKQLKDATQRGERLAVMQKELDQQTLERYRDWVNAGKPDNGDTVNAMRQARTSADANAAKLSASKMELARLSNQLIVAQSGKAPQLYRDVLETVAKREANARAIDALDMRATAIRNKYRDFPKTAQTEIENARIAEKRAALMKREAELGKQEVVLRNKLRKQINAGYEVTQEGPGRQAMGRGGVATKPKTKTPVPVGSSSGTSAGLKLRGIISGELSSNSAQSSGISTGGQEGGSRTPRRIIKEIDTPTTRINPIIRPTTIGKDVPSDKSRDITQQSPGNILRIHPINVPEPKPHTKPSEIHAPIVKPPIKVKPPDIKEPPPKEHDPNKTQPPEEAKPWTQEDVKASAAWKQGFGIRAYRPPYGPGDFKWFKTAPEGMKVSPDMKSAFSTIQTTTGTKKASFDVRVGFENVSVRGASRTPGQGSIEFHQNALSQRPHRKPFKVGKPKELGMGIVRDRRGQHVV